MVGFFDAASQATQLSLPDDSQFFTFIGLCHKLLLNEVLPDPASYAMSSLLMQHMPAFDRGRKLGGSEYFEFIKIQRPPMGLGRLIGQYDLELKKPPNRGLRSFCNSYIDYLSGVTRI